MISFWPENKAGYNMSALFDTLDYTKGAEAVGIKREHAEYQASRLAKIIEEHKSHTVTKLNLSGELKSLEVTMIKWAVGIAITQTSLILAVLGFIFKH